MVSTATLNSSDVMPNDSAERRARRGLSLALYLSRVRSSEVLGGAPPLPTVSPVHLDVITDRQQDVLISIRALEFHL